MPHDALLSHRAARLLSRSFDDGKHPAIPRKNNALVYWVHEQPYQKSSPG